jgi:uncharacterized membrane protein SirB2
MSLSDAYPLIKATHVGLAMASGGLFACRGAGVLMGATLPMSAPVRRLSQVIDTALLVAALLLLVTLQLSPFTTPWLQAKLALLVAYIVCGTLALKRAPGRGAKVAAFVVALICFAMIVVIARTHDPLGLLRVLPG